jgi:DNA-binding transcriptional LysR family regulator
MHERILAGDSLALRTIRRQERCLRELSETKHFAFAARRLHISQSALYAMVQSIESVCGFKLLERCDTQVRPMEHAVARAARMLANIQEDV